MKDDEARRDRTDGESDPQRGIDRRRCMASTMHTFPLLMYTDHEHGSNPVLVNECTPHTQTKEGRP